MYRLLRSLLFSLPPETAHRLSLKVLEYIPGQCFPEIKDKPVTIMGLDFKNPIGLAAGFDRHGDAYPALGKLGFGFIEVGTFTKLPQAGNPKPRLFRLQQDNALINRMGFYNKGINHFVRYRQQHKPNSLLGVNIGLQNTTLIANAPEEYSELFETAYTLADYITINISSPNTQGLRDLQNAGELSRLLSRLKQKQKILSQRHNRYTPLVVKVAPDLSGDAIKKMADVFLETEVDGLIATNTTTSRQHVEHSRYAAQAGGLSGKPVSELSTQVLFEFARALDKKIPIIGLGGIFSQDDVRAKFEAGASLVQLYTGLIYKGPNIVKQLIEY